MCWHGTRLTALAIFEVNSELVGLESVLRPMDVEARVVPMAVARERGWRLRRWARSSFCSTRQPTGGRWRDWRLRSMSPCRRERSPFGDGSWHPTAQFGASGFCRYHCQECRTQCRQRRSGVPHSSGRGTLRMVLECRVNDASWAPSGPVPRPALPPVVDDGNRPLSSSDTRPASGVTETGAAATPRYQPGEWRDGSRPGRGAPAATGCHRAPAPLPA
jgi:hypothetical protein